VDERRKKGEKTRKENKKKISFHEKEN